MLYNSNGLFDSKLRTELAQEYGIELLYLYPRVRFIDSQGKRNFPPFQSVYLCHNVLPEKIMFEVVDSRKEWREIESV